MKVDGMGILHWFFPKWWGLIGVYESHAITYIIIITIIITLDCITCIALYSFGIVWYFIFSVYFCVELPLLNFVYDIMYFVFCSLYYIILFCFLVGLWSWYIYETWKMTMAWLVRLVSQLLVSLYTHDYTFSLIYCDSKFLL